MLSLGLKAVAESVRVQASHAEGQKLKSGLTQINDFKKCTLVTTYKCIFVAI